MPTAGFCCDLRHILMSSRLTAPIARDWLTALRERVGTLPQAKIFPTVMGEFRRQDPFICEEIVLCCFAEAGFKIHKSPGYTGDGGIDGICYLGGCYFPIQVKRYQQHISLSDIEAFTQLVREMIANDCYVVRGFFVHSGKTGATVKKVIDYHQTILLISGRGLVDFLLDPLTAIETILEKNLWNGN